MRKGIIIGIGVLITLLALAGTGSAHPSYTGFGGYAGCSMCHSAGGFDGVFFGNTHKFNGTSAPTVNAPNDSCAHCHVQPPPSSGGNANNYNMSLNSNGSFYNTTHRYNDTTLASQLLSSPACYNCHADVNQSDFTMLSGTATYLGSTTCKICHKAKYDNWTNTMHRVMLTPNTTAENMGLPTPSVGWANISYVIVTKFQFDYINSSGYFLAENDSYETETKEFTNSTHAGGRYGTCGKCHTTGWNTTGFNYGLLNGILPGFNATNFSEPGIGCERCHNPGGNGHQVAVNYSSNLCRECHTGGSHGTGWENGKHSPPAAENGSCMTCHSPFDKYKNPSVTLANTTAQSCGVCHNIHDMTDNKYADTFQNNTFNETIWSIVANAKLSFFNATASLAAGTDIFDDLISNVLVYPGSSAGMGTGPINLTGRPVSEVLCSQCHYNHGLAHISSVNLTHGTEGNRATCTDCHMQGANASVGKDMMKQHANDPYEDVNKSCGNKCHTSSTQNLSGSNGSIVPIQREWSESKHNDKDNGFYKNASYFANRTGFSSSGSPRENNSDCMKCHSPFDWNPAYTIRNVSDFKGITCAICHNIHDMGDWINKTGKAYGWYNKDAIYSGGRYKANYTEMASTIELCGNCHSNDNPRIFKAGPGWNQTTDTTPISPHGRPAKDIFVGSFKQVSLNFECKDCHMYMNKTDGTGALLNDADKITGHSFAVNESGLQSTGLKGTEACSQCHVNGTIIDTIPNIIAKIQADTHDKWNDTNATVMAALANYNSYSGVKNLSADKIARAYWNLKMVSSDASWGVHDPVGTSKLLDDAVAFANAANASLSQGLVSTVNLKAGWNLVALNGTPSVTTPVSVMSSVASNITVVWGFNATTKAWELYDPLMPSGLNTLTSMGPGKGYWINAKVDCVWAV